MRRYFDQFRCYRFLVKLLVVVDLETVSLGLEKLLLELGVVGSLFRELLTSSVNVILHSQRGSSFLFIGSCRSGAVEIVKQKVHVLIEIRG